VTDTPDSSLHGTNITLNGLLMRQSSSTVAAPIRYEYDPLGRISKTINTFGGTATQEYNALGQLAAATDFAGNRTTYEYYQTGQLGAGQLKCETRPRGKKTYHSYTHRGEPHCTWGDVPYPEERVYSDYGELVALHTYRQGTNWSIDQWSPPLGAPSTTTWQYDGPSGLLMAKIDNSGNATRYTYENGLLKSRRWQRTVTGIQVAVTNSYNSFGDLTDMDYNDSTPDVHFLNFNRIGQPREIEDATGMNTLVYDAAGRLRLMTNTSGVLSGVAVSNHIDAPYGRDLLELWSGTNYLSTSYVVDHTSGRLAAVHTGDYWANYEYEDGSDLLKNTIYRKTLGNVMLTTTRTWDSALRLKRIANIANAVEVSSHAYEYDAMNRRRQATLEDGTTWQYGYNDRDELISAKRYWADWMPCSGQQFGYLYDHIGNRQKSWNGGDNQGGGLRETAYTANDLNQYTTVQTAGYKDIMGAALIANAVGVTNTLTGSGGQAERKGEWFHQEISVSNAVRPVWQTVAVTSGGVASNGGFAFPKSSQALTNDLDGNLITDGIWCYEWDAENRLRAMTMTADMGNLANSNRLRLEFAYDFMGRRVSKSVLAWTGTAFVLRSKEFFVYDLGGWNLIATLKSTKAPQALYVWGQDLSGTMDQAGGVGGLLSVFVVSNSTITAGHFVAYDGNGNVAALVNATDGTLSAKYEYSPFGETLRATGPMANANPFRFSTKLADHETGLVYYGYRHYSAALGKWISRDPAQENEGLLLYHFNYNNAISRFDTLGDASARDVDLGNGWSGNLQFFDTSGSAAFELHVYNRGGTEVGVLGADGWIAKHGLGVNPEIPDDIYRVIKGVGVDAGRKTGQIARGANIKNWLWNGTMGAISRGGRVAGAIVAFAAIDQAIAGGLQAAEHAQVYARHAKGGGSEWLDLDAIDIAIDVQNATGNYFMAYETLDILLQ
jgi:RHS repeat-associated protein